MGNTFAETVMNNIYIFKVPRYIAAIATSSATLHAA